MIMCLRIMLIRKICKRDLSVDCTRKCSYHGNVRVVAWIVKTTVYYN